MSEQVETNEVVETEVKGTDLPQSQSELDSLISKAVSKALDNKQAKFEADKETAIAEAIEKERSYAKMSEREKQDAELTEREQALNEREQALIRQELLNDLRSDLTEKNLPIELAELLVASGDKEQILETVNAIKGYIDTAIQNGIKESVRQQSPNVATRDYGADESVSIAEFAKQNRIVK